LSLGKRSKKDENSLDYLYIKTGYLPGKIIEVELVPSTNAVYFHLILKYEIENNVVNEEKSQSIKDYASIDLGITNLATMYIPYKRPYVIDGSEIKCMNYETKRKNAKNQKNKVGKTKKDNTWLKREQHIKNYLHVASSRIIKLLKLSNVKHLIIGYNIGWKLKCNMGKQNNEAFYKVPYRYFVNMLFYKGQDNGITVEETNESYTSKCDALNNETVGYHKSYSGKRTSRGIFQSNSGICINSDVNGAINILRKYMYRKLNNLVGDLYECIQSTKSQIHNCVKSGIVKRFLSRKNKSYIDLVLWG
jgi:putative transposase